MVARVVVTLIGLVDFGLAVDVQSWQGELDLQAGEDAWIPKANHGQCKAPWNAVTICWEYEPQNAEYVFIFLIFFYCCFLIISYVVKTV